MYAFLTVRWIMSTCLTARLYAPVYVPLAYSCKTQPKGAKLSAPLDLLSQLQDTALPAALATLRRTDCKVCACTLV